MALALCRGFGIAHYFLSLAFGEREANLHHPTA
jgi:hypothetical protein